MFFRFSLRDSPQTNWAHESFQFRSSSHYSTIANLILLNIANHLQPQLSMLQAQYLHDLSFLYQSLAFRVVLISSILVLFPYLVYLAIDILVVTNYNPETLQPKPYYAQNECLPPVIVDIDTSYLIDSADSLPNSLPPRFNTSRILGSPTPEGDDYLAFNRKLFYQNLNNSSQYLRRDSFS